MKRIATTIQLAALAALLAITLTRTAQASEPCSKSTVRGTYGSVLTGTVIGVGPFATVALVTFDGFGGWSYTESGNFNGNPIPKHTVTGSYTVAANCSGSATDSAGDTLDFVIVSGGKEIFQVGTGKGAVFTVALKKVSGSSED
jgi:hypothetical protein